MLPDECFSISEESARKLVQKANKKELELLRLFVDRQVLPFRYLQQRFGTDMNDLNLHLIGTLTKKFQKIEGSTNAGFYIYIEDTGEWAIGMVSRKNLRNAFKSEKGESI